MCGSIDNIIVYNPLGDELELKKFDDNNLILEKEYKEVFFSKGSLISGNLIQSGLQIANKSITLSSIINQAPNGLFTSTVNSNTLSRFKDGTVSTMVHKSSGSISKHAGFTEVGLSTGLNPAMVLSIGMQAMSMISGTYYLSQINNQITKIDNKLEELIKIHHDTSIGKLRAVKRGLSEISKRNFVDLVDINTIRNYKQTAEEVYEEYVYTLYRKEKELKNLKVIDETVVNDLNFYMTIALESSKLSLFSELIEIGTRMKMGGQFNIIEELTTQLEFNYANSFYMRIDSEIKKIYASISKKNDEILNLKNKKVETAVKTGTLLAGGFYGPLISGGTEIIKKSYDNKMMKKNREEERRKEEELSQEILKNKKSDSIDRLICNMIELPKREVELLYVPNGEKERIFIKNQIELLD